MTSSNFPATSTLEEAYRAAHESAVVVDHSVLGLIELQGRSRLELIHRMSTQAVKGLAEWQGAATVLTTEIGRIIDRVIVYASDDRVLMVTGEGHADALVKYFRRNIFFNDDVQVRSLEGLLLLGVYGPRAGEMLAEVGLELEELPLHHWQGSSMPVIRLPAIGPGNGTPNIHELSLIHI